MDPFRNQLTDPTIEQLLKVSERLRTLDREMPAQVISCFLYIASHENCHKQALEEDLKLTNASASRNTDWLSKYHRLNKPGLNLIIKEADPTNKRRIQMRLSAKGKLLIQSIKEDLYGSKNVSSSQPNTKEEQDQDL